MSVHFITATGTGVGKTLVTCALGHQARGKGAKVLALKPVISGYSNEDSDAHAILESLGQEPSAAAIEQIAPWRFAAPISPDLAARREGRAIDFDALVAFCRESAREAERTFIEGVGGAFVPLDETHLVADWIAALECPAIVVAGSYLGTLSHSIATVEALRFRKIPIAALIVSESEQSPMPLLETVAALAARLAPIPVVTLPRLAQGPDPWRLAPDLSSVANLTLGLRLRQPPYQMSNSKAPLESNSC